MLNVYKVIYYFVILLCDYVFNVAFKIGSFKRRCQFVLIHKMKSRLNLWPGKLGLYPVINRKGGNCLLFCFSVQENNQSEIFKEVVFTHENFETTVVPCGCIKVLDVGYEDGLCRGVQIDFDPEKIQKFEEKFKRSDITYVDLITKEKTMSNVEIIVPWEEDEDGLNSLQVYRNDYGASSLYIFRD